MKLLAIALPALAAPLLPSAVPASYTASTSPSSAERGSIDHDGACDGRPRTPELVLNDCRGPIAYTFGTVHPITRCVGSEIVVFADSGVEALQCAWASAAHRQVELVPSGELRTYAVCVTSFVGRSTHRVVAYSQGDAEVCARSQTCGALGDCTAAPKACR